MLFQDTLDELVVCDYEVAYLICIVNSDFLQYSDASKS